MKLPPAVLRRLTERTAPCSPLRSRYLKPVTRLVVQNDLPELSMPWGRLKVWDVGFEPFAITVSTPPPPLRVGSPTMVFALADSLALLVTLRRFGLPGFF